jgi:hypothetical protein
MSDTVQCTIHGETHQTFVCNHLAEGSHGLGFHREDPSGDDPHPDAWCDNCEIIRAAQDGWNDESEKLISVKLLCAECYERTRIRNTHPTVKFEELAHLKWKCASCDEWHTGPMLDVAYDRPFYWLDEYGSCHRWSLVPSGHLETTCKTFLDSEYCAIDNQYFFVRGIIELPILGASEDFRWGVWGSLSRENFETLIKADERKQEPENTQMFSWLSSRIVGYPDTLNLKMTAMIREPGVRPLFHLERGDHPLTRDFYEGITPERVKEIMFQALPPQSE